ncbi:MAG TPA: hypothetical protein VIH99_09030 [Bdellovibrionota bacterium]|jgi:hypothetical protein
MLAVGFMISLIFWGVLVILSLWGALQLYRAGALADRWLLLLPYLFAALLYFAIRYRFVYWYFDNDAIHRFFSIGAYWAADRVVYALCIPLFYGITVLRPQWVLRFWMNLPLMVILPFALKLFLYLSGAAGWEEVPMQILPTRIE